MKIGKNETIEKNDSIEIDVDDLGMDGEGVAHYLGVTVFIRGALPGERVRAKIILVKPTFLVGLLVAVLRPSPDRTEPPCPLFGKCGGCQMQHLTYSAQLAAKQKRVADTLAKAGVGCPVAPTVPSPQPYRYRNKFSLPVRGCPPMAGFFAAASHRIVPLSDCLIQFPQNKQLTEILHEWMQECKLRGFDEASGAGDVRHLVTRLLSGKLYVTLVTPRQNLPAVKEFAARLQAAFGDGFALYVNRNPGLSNVILGEKTEFVAGDDSPVSVEGLQAQVHPKSFFQVNDDVRARLYADVCALVSGRVIEAYSGAGLLSALLSRKAEHVYSVERERAAVESARQLNKANGLSNITVVQEDCATALPRLTAACGASALVVDPPRAGCAQSVLQAAAAADIGTILYISCNPATLARDLRLLQSLGYTPKSATPYDMFPQTAQVETLVRIEKVT